MKQRCIEAINAIPSAEQNCFGTALYVLGFQEEDVLKKREQFLEIVRTLFTSVSEPQKEDLALFSYNNHLVHAGIVVELQQPMIFSRKGPEESCVIDSESAVNRYTLRSVTTAYYFRPLQP